MINLIIGGVDVSEYVEVSAYNEAIVPEYDDDNAFKNYDNNEERTYICKKYNYLLR